MKKKITLILLLLISCTSKQQTVEIHQMDNTLPTVLRLNKNNNRLMAINFPIKIRLKNRTNHNKVFSYYKYWYNINENKITGLPAKVYKLNKNKMIKISKFSTDTLKINQSRQYIIYTTHLIDSTKYSINALKPHVVEMKKKNLDSLPIENLTQFKKKYQNILKEMIVSDFIEFQMQDLNSNNKSSYKHSIKL